VLDVLSDVRQRDTSLTRFGRTAMPGEHIPHSSRHTGRVSDIPVQVLIATRNAAFTLQRSCVMSIPEWEQWIVS
jgi:hypothetical protein